MPRATLFIQGAGIGKLLVERAPQTGQDAARLKVVDLGLIATLAIAAAAIVLFFGRFSASKAVRAAITVSKDGVFRRTGLV